MQLNPIWTARIFNFLGSTRVASLSTPAMTSSLRNSLHRRNHKERSQLANRSRYGFLEKHKDYVLRAKDYHSKQDRLTRLRQKASERNKDEFYFGMNRETTKASDTGSLDLDRLKLIKVYREVYMLRIEEMLPFQWISSKFLKLRTRIMFVQCEQQV